MNMRPYMDIVAEQNLAEAGAGPSRITTHIKNGDQFFMIGAHKGGCSEQENKQRSKMLKSKLAQTAALSFIATEGSYEGENGVVAEQSFFVLPRSSKTNPNNFKKLATKLMTAFDQDSILYGDGMSVFLIHQNGQEEDIGDVASFDPKIIDTMTNHSSIKGRKFSFATPDAMKNGTQYGIPDPAENKWGVDINHLNSMMKR